MFLFAKPSNPKWRNNKVIPGSTEEGLGKGVREGRKANKGKIKISYLWDS